MKKLFLGFLASIAITGSVSATEYLGTEFSASAVPNSPTRVYTLSGLYGYEFNNKVVFEARIEDEVIRSPNAQEGLADAKLAYKIPVAILKIYPFVAASVGYKSRPTEYSYTVFPYYSLEGGLNFEGMEGTNIGYSVKLRTPFDENKLNTGHLYRTKSHSFYVVYDLADNWAIGARYTRETGDENYRTVGLVVYKKF